jgi:2-polyprenyl-3-methyl-5-hydroxy-6-metoxy-1,4-benzoquinol methylase
MSEQSNKRNQIQSYFGLGAHEWIADAYKVARTIPRERLHLVKNYVAQFKPSTVLDVGCGDGRLLRELDSVPTKVGIDYSPQMLALGRSNCPEARLEQVDLNMTSEARNLKSLGLFDFICMMGVIHYLNQPAEVLHELRDLLQDQGIIMVSFRNRLYNTNPQSKYYKSPATQSELEHLLLEREFWIRMETDGGLMSVPDIKRGSVALKILGRASAERKCEGATDHYWNPYGLEQWRQWTPLEALALIEGCGLKPVSLVSIGTNAGEADSQDQMKSSSHSLAACTVFVWVARADF